ncbi:hypothetical protein [Symbioplanes lichenis]|uniref:hypothetical protein n=1 Tax=Symbioplanes lichenis TaxID=1629072 RepID=UPI0027388BAC|nr:hypothetical protein [Actinoplanes lichenis]
MTALSAETLTAVGRMSVAAAEVEELLDWVGGPGGGDPLAGARAAVRGGPGDLVNAVEAAATQLTIARSYLRRLVVDGGDPGPAAFADAAGMLTRCRGWMLALIEEHRGSVHEDDLAAGVAGVAQGVGG